MCWHNANTQFWFRLYINIASYLSICSHEITYHYIKPMYLVTYAVICSHLQKYSNSVKMTTSTGIVEGSPFVL